MKKFVTLLVLALSLFTLPLLAEAGKASSQATSPYGGVDHTNYIQSYEGPATCLSCHSTSDYGTNLLQDVISSVHFQLRSTTDTIDLPGGGSHGMLDRACGLPGTTIMANNFAGTAKNAEGTELEDGCGSCHISYKLPYKYPDAAAIQNDLDCLICHAEIYGDEWDDQTVIDQYGANLDDHSRKVTTLADGSQSWSQDRSLRAAQSVGNLPKAKYCLRCHGHGLDGYKRATPFDATHDVHAARGMDCTQCHNAKSHKIARGNYVTDGAANEVPEKDVTCAKCHGDAPHNATNAAELNKHMLNVACEVCHIPTMEGEHTRIVHKRAWAPFTFDPRTGTWEATPAMTDAEYPGFYDANTSYYPEGSTPAIRWFDGKASMLAQPSGSFDNRKSAGGKSQLYAFKSFVNGMIFDAAWLPGPQVDPSFDPFTETWPASMKFFYESNWDKFLAFGMVDAKYATPQDYWAERPDMAVMLNNFPMMLQFDRAIYLSEAGIVNQTPQPGPQTADTYPGIAKAINSGMGTMAIDMGYFPPITDPVFAGQNMWSGSFFGMWVPVNMDQTSPLYGELSSFITMSHGVKGASEAASCNSCHYTSDEYAAGTAATAKRIDFAVLAYPDVDNNGVTDPMYDKIPEAADQLTVDQLILKFSQNKKSGDGILMSLYVVDTTTRQPLAGVTVNGTLTGPAVNTELPKTYTGVTGADGSIAFTYSKTVLDPGSYTFTIDSLSYNGVTELEGCSQTITK